jgi:hypothetical protein
MFTDYKPSRGYDEYFCSEQAEPRTPLLPLLSSLGPPVICFAALVQHFA